MALIEGQSSPSQARKKKRKKKSRINEDKEYLPNYNTFQCYSFNDINSLHPYSMSSMPNGRSQRDMFPNTKDANYQIQSSSSEEDEAIRRTLKYKSYKCFTRSWRKLVLFLLPAILSPLTFSAPDDTWILPMRCLFVILVMGVYWSLEILPVSVVGLLPVVLLPFLGIAGPEDASKPYFREENVLFLCCLMIAIAVESSNVHRRIALKIMSFPCVGTRFPIIVLAFMLTTAVFGFFINNSAAAAMMIPIGDAVIENVFPKSLNDDNGAEADDEAEDVEAIEMTTIASTSFKDANAINSNYVGSRMRRDPSQLTNYTEEDDENDEDKLSDVERITRNNKRCLYLCLAYGATIGSCGSLTSNGPNIVLKGSLEKFGDKMPIEYGTWISNQFFGVVVILALTWYIMKLMYIRPLPVKDETYKKKVKAGIRKKYKELGSITFHEIITLVLIISLVFLWMLRDPHTFHGWAGWICRKASIHSGHNHTEAIKVYEENKECALRQPKDSTAAMAVLLLLFIIPSKPWAPKSGPLVTWSLIQRKLSWGLLFMRGGGFALAVAVVDSKLSCKVSKFFAGTPGIPSWAVLVCILCLAGLLTEILSNAATIVILMPITKDLAQIEGVNPLLFLLPLAIVCSLTFVLPVGTPPNSLVYDHTKMKTSEMAKPGIIIKLTTTIVMVTISMAIAVKNFDILNPSPEWMSVERIPNATMEC